MRKNIFLTGGTGLLGAYLLKEFLKEDDKNIFLLVRGKTKELSKNRTRKLLKETFKSNCFDIKDRVKVIQGDITEVNLGIEDKIRNNLIKNIDLIYHLAANTNFAAPLEDAYKVNLKGTQNLLDFAVECFTKGKLMNISHISTVAVAGDKQGVFYEDELEMRQNFHNSYEQTKFEAEQLVNKYRKKGLPILIFRPSFIIGDSITGRATNFKMFYQVLHLLSLELFSEVPIDLESPLHLVPVDHVARAIHFISTNSKRNTSHSYHIIAPNEISCGSFINLASSYFGFKMPECIPKDEFNMAKLTRIQKELITVYIPYLNYKVRFSQMHSKEALSQMQEKCPDIDRELLSLLFEFCNECGFIKLRRERKMVGTS